MAGAPEDPGRRLFSKGEIDIMVKKTYTRPALRRLGLLRQVTKFSF